MELLQLATLLIKQVGVFSHPKRLYCWAAVKIESASLNHTCIALYLIPLSPLRCQ